MDITKPIHTKSDLPTQSSGAINAGLPADFLSRSLPLTNISETPKSTIFKTLSFDINKLSGLISVK
jgi:hypothetical protein